MKLPSYVKPKPGYFKFIPVLSNYTANSIYPRIFIPQDIYEDLVRPKPDQRHIALLVHEEAHFQRQKAMGWLLFGTKYLFSSKFRFNEELLAVKEAMKYLKRNKNYFTFDRSSKNLSSHLYLWPVSKRYDEKELRKLWDEA